MNVDNLLFVREWWNEIILDVKITEEQVKRISQGCEEEIIITDTFNKIKYRVYVELAD